MACATTIYQFAPQHLEPSWRRAMRSWAEASYPVAVHGDRSISRILNSTLAPADVLAVQRFRTMIEQIDVARYALMYAQGGVYADADQEVTNVPRLSAAACSGMTVLPVESVIEGYKSGRLVTRVLVGQSLLISPPHNPFWPALWQFLLARYDPRCCDARDT